MQQLLSDAEKLSGKKFDLGNYADIVEAIHVVQEEMGIAGATAEEASATIQGSVSATKSAFDNLITGLANPDADITQLVDNLFESAINVVENIGPVVENVLEALPGLVEDFSIELGELLDGDLLQGFAEKIPELFSNIVSAIGQELPSILSAGGSLLMALVEGFTQNIDSIIESIIWMVHLMVEEFQGGDTISKLVQAAFDIVNALAGGLIQMAPELIKGAVALISELALSLTKPENLQQLITTALDLTLTLVDALISNAPQLVSAAIEMAKQIAEAIFTYDWWSVAKKIFNSIKDAIKNLIKSFGGGNDDDNPGHAGGIGFVPKDDYNAILHRGERVLTAAQNEQYSSGMSAEQYERLDRRLSSIERGLNNVSNTTVVENNFTGSAGRVARALEPEVKREQIRRTAFKEKRGTA